MPSPKCHCNNSGATFFWFWWWHRNQILVMISQSWLYWCGPWIDTSILWWYSDRSPFIHSYVKAYIASVVWNGFTLKSRNEKSYNLHNNYYLNTRCQTIGFQVATFSSFQLPSTKFTHNYEPHVIGFDRNSILSSPIRLRTNLAQYAVPVLGGMVAGRVAYSSKYFPFNPTNFGKVREKRHGHKDDMMIRFD